MKNKLEYAARCKSPAAPAEEPKPAPPKEGGAAPATAEGEAPKKKKKAAGVPPRRGKKLRNLLKNQQQRVAKEGVVSVRKRHEGDLGAMPVEHLVTRLIQERAS